MFHVGAFEVEFMGGLMTFDVVTGYGLLCVLVTLAGFLVAVRHEKSLHNTASQKT